MSFNDVGGMEKVKEEIAEFQAEEKVQNQEKMEQEFGDIMSSLVNYARFVGINPEDALEKTNQKFVNRFKGMEKLIIAEGKNLSDMSLSEMDLYWEKAKKGEN